MSDKLFRGEISPACGYCARGRLTPDGKEVLCVRKGVMPTDGYCGKFKYDPLKREPKKEPPGFEFDPEDFDI